MKKILFFLIFLIISCANPKTIIDYGTGIRTEEIGKQITISHQNKFSRTLFNEFCANEQIPSELSYWKVIRFKDFETKEVITEYVYTKGDSKINGISPEVYRIKLELQKNDTTFNVIHRQTKNKTIK